MITVLCVLSALIAACGIVWGLRDCLRPSKTRELRWSVGLITCGAVMMAGGLHDALLGNALTAFMRDIYRAGEAALLLAVLMQMLRRVTEKAPQ